MTTLLRKRINLLLLLYYSTYVDSTVRIVLYLFTVLLPLFPHQANANFTHAKNDAIERKRTEPEANCEQKIIKKFLTYVNHCVVKIFLLIFMRSGNETLFFVLNKASYCEILE